MAVVGLRIEAVPRGDDGLFKLRSQGLGGTVPDRGSLWPEHWKQSTRQDPAYDGVDGTLESSLATPWEGCGHAVVTILGPGAGRPDLC